VLARALRRAARFQPRYLTIALGLDTAEEDPTGTWSLESEDFQTMGMMIGSLRLLTLVIQEGGYDTRVLGIKARHFFEGLWKGAYTLQ
jgi:acetoin utilization deacetylase AcuC-like enzyme